MHSVARPLPPQPSGRHASKAQHVAAAAPSSRRRGRPLLVVPLLFVLSACNMAGDASDSAHSTNAAPLPTSVSGPESGTSFDDGTSQWAAKKPQSGKQSGAQSATRAKPQSGTQSGARPSASAPSEQSPTDNGNSAATPEGSGDSPAQPEPGASSDMNRTVASDEANTSDYAPLVRRKAGAVPSGEGKDSGNSGSSDGNSTPAPPSSNQKGTPAASGQEPSQPGNSGAPTQPPADIHTQKSNDEANNEPGSQPPADDPGNQPAPPNNDQAPPRSRELPEPPTPEIPGPGGHEVPPVTTPRTFDQFVSEEGLTEARDKGSLVTVPSLVEAFALKEAPENIALSQGNSHVRLQRGKVEGADRVVTIAGQKYSIVFTSEVPTLAWEGDSDNPIAEALAVAQKRGLGIRLTEGANYELHEPVVIPDNVPYFDGSDAVIQVAIPGGTEDKPVDAVTIAPKSSGTVMSNVDLNLEKSPFTRGVVADSVSDIRISDVDIAGATYRGITVSAHAAPTKNVVIEGSTIDNVDGTEETKGIVESVTIAGSLDTSKAPDSASPIWDEYTQYGTVPAVKHPVSNVTLAHNTITGGYYGINLSGASDSYVTGNTVSSNMRAISLQNNASGNVIDGNSFIDSRSSAVHIAYNSDANTVRGNTVRSSQATGQGLLQAYQESDGNTFEANTVELTGDSNPGWVLYAATGANNTTFTGNTVTGRARKAMVGIESVWDGKSAASGQKRANDASYMSTLPQSPVDGQQVTFNGGFGDLRGVTVENNVFTPADPQAPVFYVGAEVSRGRNGNQAIVGNISDLHLAGNTVNGSQHSGIVRTHAGNLPGVGIARISPIDEAGITALVCH
ncbi:MAG: right-handed parallel beta-helix repeat-containing protein [Actinomycetaceae bacterium]|nr:right-handed parallel beta-helix repeat-containing protein [Actinomycetaceae bacterium]